MSPTPTTTIAMLPPVMDNIYKRMKLRRGSRDGPAYCMDAFDRKKSTSLSSLLSDDSSNQNMISTPKKMKSTSVMDINGWSDDEDDVHNAKYRYSENIHKKLGFANVFNYNRILRQERKEFKFRLENIPKPTGKLEDFIVLKKLGCGQFGKVYLVQDFMEKKPYALKTISKDIILRNSLQHDVEAERDYLYATNSPFIVSLIHHFEDAQRVYFVEEYLSNGDIYDYLRIHGPFSEELTRFYTGQVVLALEYLHNVNLIYRDLKPENVMIDSNGYVKLVDFGFVKRVTNKTDTMVGTPAYMSPEMIYHKSYDKTVDWWSLGILVFEMMSGCRVTPFADNNRMSMYVKITTKEVAFSNKFPHTSVRDLIKRLLKINPAIRLGSGPNGSKDVKNHPWFVSTKWNELYMRNVAPPVKPSNSFAKLNNSGQNVNLRYQKVAALKQSLLGVPSNRKPDNVQHRARMEKLMMMY